MKKIILFLISMLVASITYAQQEIQIVNNTGQSINIFLIAYGDSSTFGCDSCGNSLESDVFVIPTGTTILDAFFRYWHKLDWKSTMVYQFVLYSRAS